MLVLWGSACAASAAESRRAPGPGCGDAADAYAYLNTLRRGLGLGELAPSPTLARAAESHARYLEQNRPAQGWAARVDAHAEAASRPGFTGEHPQARAVHAGYPHDAVSENVHTGAQDAREAIDGLMSGIYHRFGFLDPLLDQVGIGVCGVSFVFKMGRRDLEALCVTPPREALYEEPFGVSCPDGTLLDAAYMERFCASPPEFALLRGGGEFVKPCGEDVRVARRWWEKFCKSPPPAARHRQGALYATPCPAAPERRVGAQYLEALRRNRLARAPRYLAWPQERRGPVSPAFSNERPDPMPDRRETGYPASIEFNPERVGTVVLESFRLRRLVPDGGEAAVGPTRLLSRETDPNGRLSAHQFALFPLERLGWGARYRAEVLARVDGRPDAISWTFATRELGMPVQRLGPRVTRVRYAPGEPLALDLSASGGLDPALGDLRAWGASVAQLRLEVIDRSTVRIEIESAACDPIRLERGGRRLAELVADGCPP